MSSNSTNILTLIFQQKDINGDSIFDGNGRSSIFSYAGSIGEFLQQLTISTSANPITLPVAVVLQLYIKNLDPTNYLTVTWTPNGGSSNIVKTIQPGGFIAFSDLASAGGITALSLQAHTASVNVEMFLGG